MIITQFLHTQDLKIQLNQLAPLLLSITFFFLKKGILVDYKFQ